MKLFTACVSARIQLYCTYKVYAGLCAQRPLGLCWLYAQWPSIKVYAGLCAQRPLGLCWLHAQRPSIKVYAGLCAQRPLGLCWLHAQRPLSRSMLAFAPNDLLAYAGFTPNGLYQGLCWPLHPTTSWPMLASRPTASIKVYAGLCAQRPPGLCWLHAQRPLSRSMLAFAPNDLLASRPSIKVYAGHRAQRPIGL